MQGMCEACSDEATFLIIPSIAAVHLSLVCLECFFYLAMSGHLIIRRYTCELSSTSMDLLTHIVRFSRSEEHTSELQSLMRISYAVFCLKKKKISPNNHEVNILDNDIQNMTLY